MSLVALSSRGIQDVHFINNDSTTSLFRQRFTRTTNFAQAPRYLKTISDTDMSIIIPPDADLVTSVWFEGKFIASNLFYNSTIDLYIGGVKIDSHPFEYLTDVWPHYLADTYTKEQEFCNKVSQATENFVPLHFFFNDNGFLPMCNLQFHQVEIRVNLDLAHAATLTPVERQARCYAKYIWLDTKEREEMIKKPLTLAIHQTQAMQVPLSNVVNNVTQSGGDNIIDLSVLNHPVRSLFWGYRATNTDHVNDRLTFLEGDILLNSVALVEKMSPMYFHVVQNYYHSKYGKIDWDNENECAYFTRFYCYHFQYQASEYKSSGSVNFSRLSSAQLNLRGVEKGVDQPNSDLRIYALSWNCLVIKDGMAGLLYAS
jgi:hypothetical protein